MTTYQLIKVGKLWATKAALSDHGGTKILTLLVDTGATYTIVPIEILESIGQSTATSQDHVRIVTGSGVLMAPRVTIAQFCCVGHTRAAFPVIGHTLPPAGSIDGLLGMDFLRTIGAVIDISAGVMQCGAQ